MGISDGNGGVETLSERVLDAVSNIEAAKTVESVFSHLCIFCKSLGFDYVTVGAVFHPSVRDLTYADLGMSNFPEAFQKLYVDEDLILHDPILGYLSKVNEPFTWAEAAEHATSRGRYVFSEGLKYGLISGVAVPIILDEYPNGFISISGPDDKLPEDGLEGLELVAMHAYVRLMVLRDEKISPEPVTLTPREKDVLNYAACGYKNDAIAQRLSITPFVVKEHLSRARRKLGAKNSTHAVMMAIRDGHIRI